MSQLAESTPKGSATAALLSYRVQRHLKKIQRYQPNQPVDGLKKLVEEVQSICEAEIEAGRGEDTGRYWKAVYSQLLTSVCAKRNSLGGKLALWMMQTGGGTPAELARAKEAHRALSRLRVDLEDDLETARMASEQEQAAQQVPKQPPQSKNDLEHILEHFRSPLARQIAIYLQFNRKALDQETEQYLRDNFSHLIPANWEQSPDLPGKYFCKIRRKLGIPPKTLSTAIKPATS